MFTEEQIKWWQAYEVVRVCGQINMFDRLNGCRLSGLTKEQYTFVMENYSEIKKQIKEA